MNQIARCDWLHVRARWSYLARLGLPAISSKKNQFPESHIINPLSVKMAEFCSRFIRDFMDLDFASVNKHAKKELEHELISSHLDLTLGQ